MLNDIKMIYNIKTEDFNISPKNIEFARQNNPEI